jgi:hypothetical protein
MQAGYQEQQQLQLGATRILQIVQRMWGLESDTHQEQE